jgi:hypothetical protein
MLMHFTSRPYQEVKDMLRFDHDALPITVGVEWSVRVFVDGEAEIVAPGIEDDETGRKVVSLFFCHGEGPVDTIARVDHFVDFVNALSDRLGAEAIHDLVGIFATTWRGTKQVGDEEPVPFRDDESVRDALERFPPAKRGQRRTYRIVYKTISRERYLALGDWTERD